MRWPFVFVLAAACSSSKPAEPAAGAGTASGSVAAKPPAGTGTMSKYSLKTDAGTVTVEIAVPAGWTEDAAMSGPDGPMWKLAGARQLSLAVIEPNGSDPAVRMNKAIRMQYGDGADAERTELDGGRVWMTRKEGDNLHARIFVPFETGVVMGVAMLADDGKLPEIKQAFETIKLR